MDNIFVFKFKISGITCHACIKLIKLKIGRLEGVREVNIADTDGRTEITTEKPVSLSDIKTALNNTPYHVLP